MTPRPGDLSTNPDTTPDVNEPRPRPADALFPSHALLRRSGLCPRCGEAVDVGEFVEPVDLAEYRLSGLCLGCQVVVFTALAEMEEE